MDDFHLCGFDIFLIFFNYRSLSKASKFPAFDVIHFTPLTASSNFWYFTQVWGGAFFNRILLENVQRKFPPLTRDAVELIKTLAANLQTLLCKFKSLRKAEYLRRWSSFNFERLFVLLATRRGVALVRLWCSFKRSMIKQTTCSSVNVLIQFILLHTWAFFQFVRQFKGKFIYWINFASSDWFVIRLHNRDDMLNIFLKLRWRSSHWMALDCRLPNKTKSF